MDRDKLKNNLVKAVPFLGVVIVFLLFALTTQGRFSTMNNFQAILMQSVVTIVVGTGASFVMAHGNMDFSVGGELAICSIVIFFVGSINPWLALPAGVVVGIILSLFSAWANTIMKIPAFIAGMCIMFIGRGLAQGMAPKYKMMTPKPLLKFDTLGFYLFCVVAVLVLGFILMEYTKIGKFNKAIGANERAALLSGINVTKYKCIAFALTGACVGLAAFLTLTKGRSVTANTGLNVEINVLIALVLGGMPLSGGMAAKIRNVVVGALVFCMLSNGLSLWGTDPNIINIVKGVVFVACVFLSYDRSSNTIPV